MKREMIEFCIEFAKRFKTGPMTNCCSEDHKYRVEILELPDGILSRVDNLEGIVDIDPKLNTYSVSGIMFVLTWCFIRFENQMEDRIPIPDYVIDKKTMDLLISTPEFVAKDAINDVFSMLSPETNENHMERLRKLSKN